MGKRRCPNCGKRAPEGVVCCRNCGHSIPIRFAEQVRILPLRPASEGRGDEPAADRADELGQLVAEDYIDDPELLEQAEEEVRRLPLRLPFIEPIEDSAVDKAVEPHPVGWECPACGGQAQRGWKTCPWCRSPLPAYIWKPQEGTSDG